MELTYSLISIAVFLFLFLIGRGIMLWYWKINERIEKIDKQNKLLEEQNAHLAELTSINYLLLMKQVEKIQIQDVAGSITLISPQEWKEKYIKNKHIKFVNVK